MVVMRARDVLEMVDLLASTGVRAWLDGGWGVDALVGHQTRDHDDLDLVIPLSEADAARSCFAVAGFEIIDDRTPLCFVARDADDRGVDVHIVASTMRVVDPRARRTAPSGAIHPKASRDRDG